MRILIANSYQAIVGGIEKYLQVLIPALLDRGHDIAMVYEFAAAGGQTTLDGQSPPVPRWYWEDLRNSPPLWKELAAWKPDVVYLQGAQSLDVESSFQNAYPTVLFAHVYHGTCATGRKSHAFPQQRPCQRTFGPMCLLLHYPRRCGGLNPLTAWRDYQFQSGRKRLLQGYRSILVASTSMYREFEQHGIERARLNLVPLPNTESDDSETLVHRRVPTGNILFAGRLTKLKGVDYLIRALPGATARLGQPLQLTILGDGAERSKLEDLAQKIGVQVEFTGWLDAEAKLGVMRRSDLLAVPSLWPEPFGLVGIEAGTLGLPAVGYAVGGIPDWLIPGQTGELAPGDPPTIQGLENAIVRVFANPVHYAQLCRGAREHAREFTMEQHLMKLEAALQAACVGGSALKAAVDLTVGNGVTK